MPLKFFVYNFIRAFRAARFMVFDHISTFYYRLVCKKIGKNVRIGWGTWMMSPWNITIGNNVRIGRNVMFGAEFSDAILSISDGVQINDNVKIDFSGGVQILDSAFISESVVIYTHDHGDDPRGPAYPSSKILHKNSWVGSNVILTHGCKSIGAKSIIGSGAVVSIDIRESSIWVGAKGRYI